MKPLEKGADSNQRPTSSGAERAVLGVAPFYIYPFFDTKRMSERRRLCTIIEYKIEKRSLAFTKYSRSE